MECRMVKISQWRYLISQWRCLKISQWRQIKSPSGDTLICNSDLWKHAQLSIGFYTMSHSCATKLNCSTLHSVDSSLSGQCNTVWQMMWPCKTPRNVSTNERWNSTETPQLLWHTSKPEVLMMLMQRWTKLNIGHVSKTNVCVKMNMHHY